MDLWYAHRPKVAWFFLALGVIAFACSFFLPTAWAWIARMAALTLTVGGGQWLPTPERWLRTHERERLAIATALGLALVWMLVQYSQV